MIDKRKWRKGPPPHVGWWNASTSDNDAAWRWWDGRKWSVAAFVEYSAAGAGACAKKPAHPFDQQYVEWTNYYPANARVPRVSP